MTAEQQPGKTPKPVPSSRDILLQRFPEMFLDPQTPSFHDPETRVTHLLNLRDVTWALSDEETLTREVSKFGNPDTMHMVLQGMWGKRGKEHDDLRKITADIFEPEAVRREFVPIIQKTTHNVIDGIQARGTGSFEIGDFAYQLPGEVMCNILRVGKEHAPQLQRWAREFDALPWQEAFAPGLQPEAHDFFEKIIDDRIELMNQGQVPDGGVLDRIVDAYRQGAIVGDRPMTKREAMGYLDMLNHAGGSTTGTGLATGVMRFSDRGLIEPLSQNPHLIPRAMEENIRYDAPFAARALLVAQPVTIAGHDHQPNDVVMAWIAAANRDDNEFPEPNKFAPSRTPNRHLSFGYQKGAHYCLGSALARLEFSTALPILLDRIPGLQWDSGQPFHRGIEEQAIINDVKGGTIIFDQNRVKPRPSNT